jgi:transmembrane sensor
MAMKETEASALLKKYKAGGCSEEERAMLESWYLEWNEEGKGQGGAADDQHFTAAELMGLREEMWAAMPKPSPKVKRLWPRIVAAASIIILLSGGIWFFTSKYQQSSINTGNIANNDIAPGKNTATLTLTDGRKIILNDSLKGNLAMQAGINITKTASGEIVYQFEKGYQKNDQLHALSNTLSTGRGETYMVILPDGTKAWLNAASSLKFDPQFHSHVRAVELTGEAYFEVAKDKKRPFIVATKSQRVEVLGTHFDINSYADEGNTKTILLEGSVQLTSVVAPKTDGHSQKSMVLKPGEQAILEGNDFKIARADVEMDMAWKNGDFVFRGEQLESVLRKIARWYDVEIEYASNAPKDVALLGYISRSRSISAVLRHLERTGEVKFKLDGRKITVLSPD